MLENAKKGILIFAVKSAYYGRMAYNLAVTIKAMEDISITVVKSGRSLNHLSFQQQTVFDQIIDLPDGIPENCGAKLWANTVTPYKETLLLDADMLWLPKKKPSELFTELEGRNFTGIVEGYYDVETKENRAHPQYFFWADPAEIAEVYKVKTGKIYQWRSEVMYFKKADAIFKLAQKVFLNPKLNTIKYYASGVADELGINVATAVKGIEPHMFQWSPSFWDRMYGGSVPELGGLYAKYYLASFGSNWNGVQSQDLYNRLVKAACHKLGTQKGTKMEHVFPLQSKKGILPERSKM